MRSIKKIIEAAGGAKKIAAASQRTRWPITAKSVYDWPTIGINDRHWPILIRLAGATADELMEANARVRTRRPSKAAPVLRAQAA